MCAVAGLGCDLSSGVLCTGSTVAVTRTVNLTELHGKITAKSPVFKAIISKIMTSEEMYTVLYVVFM